MNKVLDSIFPYTGFHGCASRCQVEVFTRERRPIVVRLTELPDNPGTSVTNMFEEIATLAVPYLSVWAGQIVDPEKIIWLEHYPEQHGLLYGRSCHRAETLDRVFLKWDGQRYSDPNWKYLDPVEGMAALDAPLENAIFRR